MPLRGVRPGAPGFDEAVVDVDMLSDFDTPTEGAAVQGFVFQYPILPVVEGPDLTAIGPYIPHITVAGERWDTLAWNYYGDPTLYSGIVLANPAVPIEPQFEAGLLVKIPIVQQTQTPATLPPWGTL
jgi:phage tail protein X